MNKSISDSNPAFTPNYVGGSCSQGFMDKIEFLNSLPASLSTAELLTIHRSFDGSLSGTRSLRLHTGATRVVARRLGAVLSASCSQPQISKICASDSQSVVSDEVGELVASYDSLNTSGFRQAVLAFARIMARG